MSAQVIASTQNVYFRQMKTLADSAAARREQGKTLLDGEHLLEAWLAGGRVLQQILVADAEMETYWQTRCPTVPVQRLAPHLLSALSPVKTPTGVMALVEIPVSSCSARFGVLLERIQDPGNLGAMLRSAAAAGVDTVWLSEGCADVWSPKVLRGGMGAHVHLTLHVAADLPTVVGTFPGKVYATLPRAQQTLFELDLTGTVAFVFGNEGAGLSPELQTAITHTLSIPMPGQIESLNAAAALAVCVFERVRQRHR